MVGGSSESPSPSPLLYCSEGEIFFLFMMSIWSFIWIRTTRSLNSVTNGCWERKRERNSQCFILHNLEDSSNLFTQAYFILPKNLISWSDYFQYLLLPLEVHLKLVSLLCLWSNTGQWSSQIVDSTFWSAWGEGRGFEESGTTHALGACYTELEREKEK